MDRDIYEALQWTAQENFSVGIRTYTEFDTNHAISKSRLAKYKSSGKFRIESIEDDFHTIGFLDAIAWLSSQGYIDFKKVEKASDISLRLEDDADPIERVMMESIITDADMLEQFCADVQCYGFEFDD